MAYAEKFTALAPPMRRAVFERLIKSPASVGDIAAEMPISRPAVSQHLSVLKQAKLVTDTRRGNHRIYAPDPSGIADMRRYFDDMWDQALLNFKTAVEIDNHD